MVWAFLQLEPASSTTASINLPPYVGPKKYANYAPRAADDTRATRAKRCERSEGVLLECDWPKAKARAGRSCPWY